MPKPVERYLFLSVPAAMFLIGYFYYPDMIKETLLVCCMATIYELAEELIAIVDDFDLKLKNHEKRLSKIIDELKKIESDKIDEEQDRLND